MTTQLETAIKLICSFGGDPTIYLTTDSQYPIANSRSLYITNDPDRQNVVLKNQAKITPKDPSRVPPVDSTTPVDLDRIYLLFQWGDSASALATVEESNGITCAPAPTNHTWDVLRKSSATDGYYWVLWPKDEVVITDTDSYVFDLDSIISMTAPGQPLARLILVMADGTRTTFDANLFKKIPELQVHSFTSNDVAPIDPGQKVTFSWQAWSATKCVLEPGSIDAKPYDSATVTPSVDQPNYSVTAYDGLGHQATSATHTVRFKPVEITSALTTSTLHPPPGSQVELNWKTAAAESCTLTDSNSPQSPVEVPLQGPHKVTVSLPTTFTLTAKGSPGPVTSNLKVFPIARDWNEVTRNAPWSFQGRPLLLSFQEKMWIMGAGNSQKVYASPDGERWNTVLASAPWSARSDCAGAVFNDALWLLSGVHKLGGKKTYFNDVWTSCDGTRWERVLSGAPWSARSGARCVAFQKKLWICGGLDQSGSPLNDVWNSSDGKTWTQVTSSAPWTGRSDFGLAIFNDRLWVVAGRTSTRCTNEVWSSSDGKSWQSHRANWSSRAYPALCTAAGKLWLFGGESYEGAPLSNFFFMDENASWSMPAGPPNTSLSQLGVTNFQGALWYAGGRRFTDPNDPKSSTEPNLTVLLYGPEDI